jgi:hypothetical protein
MRMAHGQVLAVSFGAILTSVRSLGHLPLEDDDTVVGIDSRNSEVNAVE